MSVLDALIFCALTVVGIHGYPEGAPVEACENMIPQHVVPPQTTQSPYGLSHVANGDGTYQVILERLSDNEFENYRGFFIQARSESTGNDALGMFSFEDNGLIQSRPCPEIDSPDNGVTHVSAVDLKDVVEVTWSPGETGTVEGLYFVASVVLNYPTFWVDIRSPVL